ncbi:hypothetical protein C8F01DRAFT_1265456 [Mycena amicta]|nr:hypothetical protein C8F01DRAFT_1265456 [Mycena amicta]
METTSSRPASLSAYQALSLSSIVWERVSTLEPGTTQYGTERCSGVLPSKLSPPMPHPPDPFTSSMVRSKSSRSDLHLDDRLNGHFASLEGWGGRIGVLLLRLNAHRLSVFVSPYDSTQSADLAAAAAASSPKVDSEDGGLRRRGLSATGNHGVSLCSAFTHPFHSSLSRAMVLRQVGPRSSQLFLASAMSIGNKKDDLLSVLTSPPQISTCRFQSVATHLEQEVDFNIQPQLDSEGNAIRSNCQFTLHSLKRLCAMGSAPGLPLFLPLPLDFNDGLRWTPKTAASSADARSAPLNEFARFGPTLWLSRFLVVSVLPKRLTFPLLELDLTANSESLRTIPLGRLFDASSRRRLRLRLGLYRLCLAANRPLLISAKVPYFPQCEAAPTARHDDLAGAYGMLEKMHLLVRVSETPRLFDEQRLKRATPQAMAAFHTDEYVNFLNRVTPETAEELTHGGLLFSLSASSSTKVSSDTVPSPRVGLSPPASGSGITSGGTDIAINWRAALRDPPLRRQKRREPAFPVPVPILISLHEPRCGFSGTTRARSGAILLSAGQKDPPAKLAFDSSLHPPPPSLVNAALSLRVRQVPRHHIDWQWITSPSVWTRWMGARSGYDAICAENGRDFFGTTERHLAAPTSPLPARPPFRTLTKPSQSPALVLPPSFPAVTPRLPPFHVKATLGYCGRTGEWPAGEATSLPAADIPPTLCELQELNLSQTPVVMRALHLPPRSTTSSLPHLATSPTSLTVVCPRHPSVVFPISLHSTRPSRAVYRSSHEERFELAVGEQVVEVVHCRASGPVSGLGPGLRCNATLAWAAEAPQTILQNGLDD